MTAIETYIASTAETDSVNGGITTLSEIYITIITEHDKKTTKNLFDDKNSSTHIKSKVAVCSIQCLDCNENDVGKTSCNLQKWIYEHKEI